MQRCKKYDMDLQEKANTSINDAFSLIIERHGRSVFKEGNRLLGLLGDYAPNLVRERKLVKIAVESGAYRALYEADISEKTGIVNKYISILTESYFIDETWARKAIHWCLEALSRHDQKSGMELTVDDFQPIFEFAQKTKAEGRIQEAVNLYALVKDNSEYERKAQMCLAELYDGQAEKVFQCYHRAAVLGDAKAQFLVGYMYEYGEGIGKQLDQAVIWYRKAAANGNRGAQHNLGYFYYCGIEVKQDLRRAFEYFMLAARQGKPDSMRNLGVMYELGQYVNRDMEEAMRWYKLAAENGDSNAYEDYIRLDKMIDFLDH